MQYQMIFGWFDARAARAFGTDLARAFIASVPADGKLRGRKFEAKSASALKHLERQVADFKRKHQLNFYQKASLGNTFKWALREGGYDDAQVIDTLTDWLMLQLR